jgi:hypothetical protein
MSYCGLRCIVGLGNSCPGVRNTTLLSCWFLCDQERLCCYADLPTDFTSTHLLPCCAAALLPCTPARLCPEGVEATLFATLMSILNGGSFVGSALGAGLTAYLGVSSTDFSNLFLLVLLCNFSTLLPAPFLGLLPSTIDQDSTQAAAAGEDGDVEAAAGGSSNSDGRQTELDAESGQGQQQQQQQGQHMLHLPAAGSANTHGVPGKAAVEKGLEEDEGLPLQSSRRK